MNSVQSLCSKFNKYKKTNIKFLQSKQNDYNAPEPWLLPPLFSHSFPPFSFFSPFLSYTNQLPKFDILHIKTDWFHLPLISILSFCNNSLKASTQIPFFHLFIFLGLNLAAFLIFYILLKESNISSNSKTFWRFVSLSPKAFLSNQSRNGYNYLTHDVHQIHPQSDISLFIFRRNS